MRRVFGHLSWYTAIMLANSAIGLLVVPATIYIVGADEWGAVAVGQAVGSIATIFVALGWGYNGPSLIARASDSERRVIAINSLIARSIAGPVFVIAAAVVTLLLAPTFPWAAVIASLTVSLGGMGMGWYFVGEGKPKRLFLLDGVPRWLGSVLGVGALFVWQDLYVFLWIQLLGGVLSSLISTWIVVAKGPEVNRASWGMRAAFSGVRSQMYAGITVVTATSFASLPTLVIAALAPSSVPVYALGERLMRLALMALTPLFQWAQGWVPKSTLDRPVEWRIKVSTRAAYGLCLPVGLAVAFGGPLAGDILSAGVVTLPLALTIPMGIAVATSLVSRVVGMACLLALGKDKQVAMSAVYGSVVGTPLLFILVLSAGSTGAAVSLAISETIVVIYQIAALRKAVASTFEPPIAQHDSSEKGYSSSSILEKVAEMSITTGEVVGVLVTYNTSDEVLAKTITRLAPELQGLLVMDNSEKVNGLSRVIEECAVEGVEYISSSGNVGIAEAQNRGIARAIQLGANFVLFLDDDSDFPKGGVRTLLRDLAEERTTHARTAGIGPRVVDERTGQALVAVWEKNRIRPGFIDGITEVAYLVSSGALIDIKAFQEFGLFRSDYFIDHVDQEWGFRVTILGGRLVISPNVIMPHELGDVPTLSRKGKVRYTHDSSVRDYYLTRNAVLLMRDLKLPPQKYPGLIRLLIESSMRKILGRSRTLPQRKAVLRGLVHGARNRRGKL